MKKILPVFSLVAAAACLVLRKIQLAGSFDAEGLPIAGSKTSIILYGLCALAIAVIALICLREKKTASPTDDGKSSIRGIAVIVSALALVFSYMPPDLSGGAKLIVPALAFAAACAIAIEGVFHMQGQSGSLLGGCVLPVYLAVVLITDYRSWSYDPIVSHFCFEILFLVCAMLASFHLAAFRIAQGKRRVTAFFAAAAIVFAGPVLVDGDFHMLLRVLALCLYLAAELWPFLAPGPEIVEPAEETAEPEPTEE